LTKTGSGTLILANTNTYAGTTLISTGTLQLGNAGTTGSLSPSSAITDNSTLVFDRTNAVLQGTDFANVISGSGGVTQAGSGTLTFSGVNMYTGATTVNAGTLLVTGSTHPASAVAVNSGATLGGTGNAAGTITMASGG